jgi:hypothetical protein
MSAEAEVINDNLPLVKSDDFMRKGNVIYVKRFTGKTLDNILESQKEGFDEFMKAYPFMRAFMPLVPMILKNITKDKGKFIEYLHDNGLEISISTHDCNHLAFTIFKNFENEQGEMITIEHFKLLIPSEDL